MPYFAPVTGSAKRNRRGLIRKFFLGCAMLVVLTSVPVDDAMSRGHRYSSRLDATKRPCLPDLFITSSGEYTGTEALWESIRRPELLDLFRHNIYGYAPDAAPVSVREERIVDKAAFGGLATLREIDIAVGDAQKIIIRMLLVVPNASEGPHPVFLYLNKCGNHTLLEHRGVTPPRKSDDERRCTWKSQRGSQTDRWPLETIVRRGYAVASFFESDIARDATEFSGGVYAQFPVNRPQELQWGLISAWSWGLSRAVDYLVTDKDIDTARIAVLGHSRRGKAALWAAAQDKRIGLAIVNQSGTAGAAVSRSYNGESVQQIYTMFPHWFNEKFREYMGREAFLPVDQHQLLALVAPRPMLLNNAEGDEWADPEGTWIAARAADPAYKMMDTNGLIQLRPDAFDPKGVLAYHIRPGDHGVTHLDWEAFLNFADAQMKHRPMDSD